MKTKLLPLILIQLLFFACKKNREHNAPINDFAEERVKTIQWDGGGLATYTYDNEKRQTKEVQNTGTTTEFIYETGKITRLVIQSATTASFKYTLNAEGYVKTLLTPDGITYNYEYTPKGMIAKQYSDESIPFVANYFYNHASGLLDSIRQTVGSIWHSTSMYTYYMDKTNSLKNKNLGLKSYGEEFLRPIKRYRSLYRNGNIIQEQISDFTYTYDSKGRITKKTYDNSGQQFSYNYTYY